MLPEHATNPLLHSSHSSYRLCAGHERLQSSRTTHRGQDPGETGEAGDGFSHSRSERGGYANREPGHERARRFGNAQTRRLSGKNYWAGAPSSPHSENGRSPGIGIVAHGGSSP